MFPTQRSAIIFTTFPTEFTTCDQNNIYFIFRNSDIPLSIMCF